MARYTDAVCKLCRREQQKLFLKGDKCYTKCVLEKRPGIPGVAKPQRGKPSASICGQRQRAETLITGAAEHHLPRPQDDARRCHSFKPGWTVKADRPVRDDNIEQPLSA